MLDRLLELAPGLMLGGVIGLFLINRSLTRAARLGFRRELVMLKSVRTLEDLLQRAVRGTLDEDELRLGLQMIEVGWIDEMAGQRRVGLLTRIPSLDEPWPDAMLGDVMVNQND